MSILIVCRELLMGHLLSGLLKTAGNSVDVTNDFSDPENLARRNYSLIVVNTPRDPSKSVAFCKAVKKVNRSTKVALLVGAGVYLEHETCHDCLISRDSTPEEFMFAVASVLNRAEVG
jgi:DNA-binding response OmpR family regulator